jgi:hypothetical protein
MNIVDAFHISWRPTGRSNVPQAHQTADKEPEVMKAAIKISSEKLEVANH